MIDLGKLLTVLSDASVEHILVGGMAGIAHGAARATFDVDVVYRRTPSNIAKVIAALGPIHPYLRGAPRGLPFLWDVKTIERGLNFTLTTDLGDIDLLGEITGGGGYEELLPNSFIVEVFGVKCQCLGLAQLIQVKRASGRNKDLEAIAELEKLLGEEEKKNRRP